jgi:hypothetical protein
MNENTLITLKRMVADALMENRGWDRSDLNTQSEFDITNENSQLSMAYEDATVAVDATLRLLMDLKVEPEIKEERQPAHLLEPENRQAVSISNSLFIFMDSGRGKPLYVRDVRYWLDAVDTAGVPEDAEIEGKLYLSYDTDLASAETMECDSCGRDCYLLVDHHC